MSLQVASKRKSFQDNDFESNWRNFEDNCDDCDDDKVDAKKRKVVATRLDMHHYIDERDAQLDACNKLRVDLALLDTREKKRDMIRQRMPSCYKVFLYILNGTLRFGSLQDSQALDDCDEDEVDGTTCPQSLFQYLDYLMDSEQSGCETAEDSARTICAWIRDHSDHADWISLMLDHDKYGLRDLFGPLVSIFSLESNLRWYIEQIID